jgi:hypothetical protein
LSKTDYKHHYIASGNVMWREDENLNALEVNAVLIIDQKNIAVKEISQLQRLLMISLFKQLKRQVEIEGVVITSINYLGAMTEKEWNNLPPSPVPQAQPEGTLN